MPARRPHDYLFTSLTVLLSFTLLAFVPQGLAQEAVEPDVSCFTGVISGTCFHDANRNSLLDDGEGGVAGIPLSLKRINLLFRPTEVGTTVSDGGGRYSFVGLRRGFYLVEVQSTAEWKYSTKNPRLVIVARFIESKARDFAFQKKPGLPSVSITAIPSEITEGQSAALIWSSENADAAYVDQGIGTVMLDGTLIVTPEQTTVYTITAEGALGTAQDSVTVIVKVPVTTTTTIPEIVQDSFVLSEFRFNSMDTHMYWDGTYLWLPETEYLSDTVRFSTNLIRLNPEDFSYTRYNLPRIEYKEEDIYPIVYEVVPSPSNSDILYISAPYGEPKAIYVFSQLREAAEGYRLVNGNLVYGGNNGARMAVTTSGGNDTIWITCNDSKIGVFDVASAAMTELHDFSSIAPGGLYGMAAVPAATGEGYLIHVASFGGKLLIFPSDLTAVDQNMTIDVADYGVSEASLTALIYDEPYIWVAGHGRYNGSFRLFIMRYMPASQYDMEGECTFYWSHVSIGMIPSIVSYGNWVFAVVENFDDCYVRYLIRLDKTTGVVDAIEIAFQNPRIAASLGHDGDGNIYAGGFGCRSKFIRPLELVRFEGLAAP